MLSYDVKCVLTQYWKDLGNPCALALAQAVENDSWDIVQKIITSFDQNKEMSVARNRLARLAIDIIKKADYLPVDVNRAEACIKSFIRAEDMCRDTNRRFMLAEMNHSSIPIDKMRLIKRVKRMVKRIMGPLPDMMYHEGMFGPGATLSNPRSKASLYEKLSTLNPTVTQECMWFYPILPTRLRDCWGPEDKLEVARANQFHLVPKNFKTDRGICIEPLINAYVQRGFGLHFKKRLRQFGIDLDRAPEAHRELARIGSIDGSIATIDMSMASDTIAKKVVEAVLPADWFRVLDAARSHCTDLLGIQLEYAELLGKYDRFHYLEKFSSMGNGFTFELETILFTAIARACGDPQARSFGDDLIVKKAVVNQVIDALKFFGFEINIEKTFARGSFRESCGGDFRYGEPVKGVTLKTEPKCVDDWYDLHNRLFVMAQDYHIDITRTLNLIRNQVPRRLRFAIPTYFGNGGFFSDRPRGRWDYGIFRCKTYRRISVQRDPNWENEYTESVMLASILLGGSSCGPTSSQKMMRRVVWDPPVEMAGGWVKRFA